MKKTSKSCFIKLWRPWETQDSTLQRKIRRGRFSRVSVEKPTGPYSTGSFRQWPRGVGQEWKVPRGSSATRDLPPGLSELAVRNFCRAGRNVAGTRPFSGCHLTLSPGPGWDTHTNTPLRLECLLLGRLPGLLHSICIPSAFCRLKGFKSCLTGILVTSSSSWGLQRGDITLDNGPGLLSKDLLLGTDR